MTFATLLSNAFVSKAGSTLNQRWSRSVTVPFASRMIAVLMAAGGWGVCGLEAIAQSVTEGGGDGRITTNNGAVFLDNNAFDFRTGPLENDSNIPLPSRLPRNIQERQPQEVDRSRLAPNTIELTTDVEYIEGSLRTILQREVGGEEYTFNSDSLELETNFDVRYRQAITALVKVFRQRSLAQMARELAKILFMYGATE